MITFLIYFYFLCATLTFILCLEDIRLVDSITVRDALKILAVVVLPAINVVGAWWFVRNTFKINFPKFLDFKIWTRKAK